MTLILADTNIALRMVERDHTDHLVAMSGVREVIKRGVSPVLVPQVLYEFWVVATRPTEANGLGMSPAEAHREINELLLLFRLLKDERAIYEYWLDLVAKKSVLGKQAHDARLVAAMHRHRISHCLTFNHQDFLRYSDLVVVVPQDATQLPFLN